MEDVWIQPNDYRLEATNESISEKHDEKDRFNRENYLNYINGIIKDQPARLDIPKMTWAGLQKLKMDQRLAIVELARKANNT